MKNDHTAERIVAEAGLGSGDLVVELGAGGGMLTRQLARAARGVVAVECDPYWVALLRKQFPNDGNVHVVQGDALKVRLPEERFKVVANIPFNATTPILHRILDDPTNNLESAHLLVQKQVALKHAKSRPTTLKTLNWSPWYAFSAGLRLPADAFHPRPGVNACLMAAARRGRPLVEPGRGHLFRAFVRRAFEGRGDSVGRILRPIFTKRQLRKLASDNGFSLGFYPSMLTVHQWANVFDFMVTTIPQDRWPRVKRHSSL